MSRFERAARRLLKRPARFLLGPLLRRIEQVNHRAEEVGRHLPIVENVIESQNAELRLRARSELELRAELASVKADLARMSQRLDALLCESGPGSQGSSPDVGGRMGGLADDERAASSKGAGR